jgi:hypothetical protein
MMTSSMLLAACTHEHALTQRDTAAGKPAATSAPAQTTHPVATATSSGGSADSGVNTDLLKQGYHTGRHNGQLVYCRYQQVTGTMFKSEVCLTEAQILEQQRRARDAINVPPQH